MNKLEFLKNRITMLHIKGKMSGKLYTISVDSIKKCKADSLNDCSNYDTCTKTVGIDMKSNQSSICIVPENIVGEE